MVLWPDKSFFDVLQDVTRGFQSRPFELVLLILILAGFVIFLVVVVSLQVKRRNEERIRRAQQLYEQAAAAKKLTKSERNIIEYLSRELTNGHLRKHEIINDLATFAEAAEKLRAKGRLSRRTIYEMRNKLKSSGRPPQDEEVKATRRFEEGMHIYFIDENNRRFHGTIVENRSSILLIKPNVETAQLSEGLQLAGYFKRPDGIYSFKTHVHKKRGDIIACPHSDTIKKEEEKDKKNEQEKKEQKKRDFFRKEIKQQILIQYHVVDAESVETMLLDLGGGGARVGNPEEKFKENDTVLLHLDLAQEGEVAVGGKVVGVSEDKKELHIQFDNIPDSTRDKIMGFLFHTP